MTNPLPVSLTFGNSANCSKYYERRDKLNMERFISSFNPDVVHLHTIMGLPIEFLQILKKKGIKIVYTTHDYYGLCPKILKSDALRLLEKSSCSYDCLLCNDGPSLFKIKIMQSHFYQKFKESSLIKKIRKKQSQSVNTDYEKKHFSFKQVKQRYKLRMYYLELFSLIDLFHFNSTVAEKVFKSYLPNIKGKVVPLTTKGIIKDKTPRVAKDNVSIGFAGGIDVKKGFSILKNVSESLENNGYKFKVLCTGSNANISFFNKNYVNNLGVLSRSQMKEFYKKIDILLVPSIWHETFGLVVVEAISRNLPVLCSNNVGAQDILPNYLVYEGESELYFKLAQFISSKSLREKDFNLISKMKINFDFADHVNTIKDTFYS